ncbi:MAG: hypothetical protein ACFCUT_11675 [Kiloniellaceae bacterium]
MRASILIIVTAFCLFAWSEAAEAAENSLLVGTWTAEDPDSGEQEQLIITPETLQFGVDEPQIPYTAQGSGGFYEIFIGGPGNLPARFTFRDADTAELAVPGGPTIALTRAAAAAEVAPAAADDGSGGGSGGGSLLDEMTAALLPHGVTTRFEPLDQSLEDLLSAGWKLDQAGGASGGFTLLLSNGATRALCVLVPKDLGQADTALSDCRRLN